VTIKVTKGEWRTIPYVHAYCDTCEWECYAKNAHAVGAIHARSHNHLVWVERCRTYCYNHDPRRRTEEVER